MHVKTPRGMAGTDLTALTICKGCVSSSAPCENMHAKVCLHDTHVRQVGLCLI